MTIQDMGAIGDLIGGVAVVVTLVYLAIQIRQNTKVHASLIRQNFYDATQQQMRHGGVFNQDFLDEVESLKEEASPYKQQLDEKGLQL